MKLSEIIKYVENNSVAELIKLGLQSYFDTTEENLNALIDKFETHEYRRISESINYFENSIADIKNNIKEYEWLYSVLSDDQSKTVLEHMLTAKLKFDTTEIEKAFSMDQIYFDKKIWGSLENECYVDCGAFKGDTIIQFAINCPDFEKIYAFEAIPEVMDVCQNEVQELAAVIPESISFYTNAVSDERKDLYFDVGMMQGESKATEQGNLKVEATSLDEVLTSRVSFIKMDIEGSELEAIRGAKRIIQEYTPKMAICIYHKYDDFWQIPKQIMEYNSDYHFYIRQHDGEVYSETVLYCIPANVVDKEHRPKISSEVMELRFCKAMDKCSTFTVYEVKKIYDYLNTRKWYLKMLMHQKNEIRNLTGSNTELQQWISEITVGKLWLENQLTEQKKYIADLNEGNNWLEQHVKDLEAEIDNIANGKEWLQQQCNNHVVELKNKDVYIAELIESKQWLEQHVKDLEAEIDNIANGKEWLQQQCNNHVVELKNKDAYITELVNAKEWLEQQTDEHEKYIAELVDAKQWLEEQNKIKVNETEKLELNVAELEQRISELENENSKLNYRLNTLKEDKLIQKVIKMKKYQV